MKRYIGLIICCSVLLTACSKSTSTNNETDDNSQSFISDSSNAVSSSENETIGSYFDDASSSPDGTEESIDKNIGINSLRVDDSELSDDQKMLISYTDDNYFRLNNYELIQRYPDAFDNSQVVFTGQIEKILSADDKTYSVLATLNEYHDNVFISQNEIVINGNHADNYSDKTKNYRIIAGDRFKCFGVSRGSQTVSDGGESLYLPVFDANQIIVDNGIGHYLRYNISYVKDLANVIFPNGVKIREPIEGQDFNLNGTWDGIHDYSDMFLIGEPDNQSNANFTKYEFYQSRGYIRDNKSTADIIRQLKMSLDMQHYILTIYDSALKTFTIEYYDLSYNKIWSREFTNASIYKFNTLSDNDFFDYTESAIYLDLNNNLYVIDLTTGEDKISPVTVGEKTDIRKTSDSIFLMSDRMTDTVIKTDLEGNILWKLDLPLYEDELKTSYENDFGADFNAGISAVQFNEKSIKIEYQFTASVFNEEYGYTDCLYYASKIFVIDNDGNMLMNTEIL